MPTTPTLTFVAANAWLDNASYFENLSKSMPTLFGHGSFNGLAAMGTAASGNNLDEIVQDSKSDLDMFSTAEENSDALIQAETLPVHDGEFSQYNLY